MKLARDRKCDQNAALDCLPGCVGSICGQNHSGKSGLAYFGASAMRRSYMFSSAAYTRGADVAATNPMHRSKGPILIVPPLE